MSQLWDICWGTLLTRCGEGEVCYRRQSWRSWNTEKCFGIRNGDAEFGLSCWFWSCTDPVFLHFGPFLPFCVILCWKYVISILTYILLGVTIKRLSWVLNSIENVIDFGNFGNWTNCILKYNMASFLCMGPSREWNLCSGKHFSPKPM